MPVVRAISDLHGRLPRAAADRPDVPPCDVLIIAGDVCPDFHGSNSPRSRRPGSKSFSHVYAKGEAQQANWLSGPFREWLADVQEHCGEPAIVGVAGNHDFVFEAKVEPNNLPWTYLWDQETTVRGLRMFGTPWCPKLGRWAFYADDRRLRLVYDNVPEGLDVLISHSPPRGYGDKIPTSSPFNVMGDQDLHVGTPQLTNILYEKKPKVVVSGHIHEARGRYEYRCKNEDGSPATVIYNVAYLNELYEPYGPLLKPSTELKELA